MLEPEQVESVKGELLGFLLYGTPDAAAKLLAAFGSEEAGDSALALRDILPGPHAILRCLTSISAGKHLIVCPKRNTVGGCFSRK